jgi:hypothetical protein
MKKHSKCLTEATQPTLHLLERVLTENGFDVENDGGKSIIVETPAVPLFMSILDGGSILDMSGIIELRPEGPLHQKLRLANWLNNADLIVRYSLGEAINANLPIDRILLPDVTAIWCNIALPVRCGFSAKPFLAAVNLLIDGLQFAFAAAEEDGLLDGANCDKCAEQFETEEDSYAH